jgi:hypothetical protein
MAEKEIRKLTDEEIEQIVEVNEKLGEAHVELTGKIKVLMEALEKAEGDLKISSQKKISAIKEHQMLTTRCDMLEKQRARTAGIIDNAVEILFGERFGQKELESDPVFKAFKLIRKAVDKQELGKPNSMAHDFKPNIMS